MKPIPNFPGYFATEAGEIYSTRLCGQSKGNSPIHPLKGGLDGGGYRLVILCREGERFTRKVHRLILETFVGPRPEGMECCHGPNGKLDNSLANLSWGTKSKNHGEDQLRDGTDSRGERNHNVKLNDLQVRIIRRLKGELTQRVVADVFGITQANVYYIQKRGTRGWL